MQANNFNKKKAQQAGFSLIELLVAMVISLTLIFGCTALYRSLKSSMTTAQHLAEAQESLRGAFYLMSRSVYHAADFDISGAINTNQQLIVTYDPPPSGELYSCLGTPIASARTDIYSSDGDGLYCDDGTGAQLIALDVEKLQFEAINDNGIKVFMKITYMPESMTTSGAFPDPVQKGLTFSLALRQKILLDLAE